MSCQLEDHPTAPLTPRHSPVAIARNGRSRSTGTPGRNQSESVVAISRNAQFRIGHDGDRDLVEVLRILHDAMDAPRHMPKKPRTEGGS